MSSSWARLVSLTSDDAVHSISDEKSKFTIGRLGANDYCLTGNRLVSGRHCFIEKDDDGKIWIEDSSTNGTLVDGNKLKKGERAQLGDGSEIKLVYKGPGHASNVILRFDNLNQTQQTLEMSDNDLEDAEEEPKPKKACPDSKPQADAVQDEMEESLQCGICREILHDCISLQPCMHSFCGGCYSQWMARSNVCPHCRVKVVRISKNHIVNNLVVAYLKEHPDKRRSAEELEALDKENKITHDMLNPKRQRRSADDDDEEEDDDEEDDDEEDDDYDDDLPTRSQFVPPPPPPPLKCRLCPGYAGPHVQATGTSDPGYQCPTPAPVHLLCHCCMEPMPNRIFATAAAAATTSAASASLGSGVARQQCDVCRQYYCHLYWTCKATNCRGCLGAFTDISLADHHLNGIINGGNAFESNVLKDYLESNGLSIRDVLKGCANKLDSREWTSTVFPGLKSDTVTCYRCCLKSVHELAYFFRKDLPDDDLPDRVTQRPDCYWGRNCRTQRNKPDHARRFNHICEQTRFS